MIDAYLQSKAELDDHAIHLLFSANRWECVYVVVTSVSIQWKRRGVANEA
jgi:dTMP kinase